LSQGGATGHDWAVAPLLAIAPKKMKSATNHWTLGRFTPACDVLSGAKIFMFAPFLQLLFCSRCRDVDFPLYDYMRKIEALWLKDLSFSGRVVRSMDRPRRFP
jgi:hypothetical protein